MMTTSPINWAHLKLSKCTPRSSQLAYILLPIRYEHMAFQWQHMFFPVTAFCTCLLGVLINPRMCVLYQELINTYERSSKPSLVISATSEHLVLILTLRQGTKTHEMRITKPETKSDQIDGLSV